MLSDLSRDVERAAEQSGVKKVPSIVEFVQTAQYLDFNEQNGNALYPAQMIALKLFYRGSIGNQDVKLTEQQIRYVVEQLQLNCDQNGDAMSKYNTIQTFNQLVLVWGRRSGKDFVVGIIAIYQTVRLLIMSDGDPYGYYGIGTGNNISILTIASAAGQAQLAFNQISDKFFRCKKFFKDRVIPQGIQMLTIYIMTDRDIKQNQQRKQKKMTLTKGSIEIRAGHSNSNSLRGQQPYVCILDQVAFYHDTGGASSGAQIYQGLGPAVKTYVKKLPILDQNGNKQYDSKKQLICNRRFDGKIICISSPAGQQGILWRLFSKANNADKRLALRMPTWKVNLTYTRQSLRSQFPDMPQQQFNMQFGAQFSGTSGNSFFPRQVIDKAFNPGFKLVPRSGCSTIHFAHLDPATSSHNYALCILHKQMFIKKDGSTDYRIIVDHLKYWHPQGKVIPVQIVDEYVVGLKSKFHLAKITYDQHRSQRSIKVLRQAGLPAQCTPFNMKFKMSIYQDLFNLLASQQLVIPDDGSKQSKLLKQQMYNLQRKPTFQGWKVMPSRQAQCKTDDLLDALAAAVHQCLHAAVQLYPRSRSAVFGGSQSSNQQVWRSPSGIIGHGSAKQINDARQSINSWPKRFR